MRVWLGEPYPLGAIWDGEGVNFALFSEHATSVDLCLFDRPDAQREAERIAVRQRTNSVWHAYLPDVRPNQLYGYRVDGPYEPRAGLRFNPSKLLIDPYARALSGSVELSDAVFDHAARNADGQVIRDDRDSAPYVPKGVVVDSTFAWGGDRPPNVPLNRSLIYECHVKGMTINHPGVPERLRGTYLGLASDTIIEHLAKLGVTAVELLPVHHAVTEPHLSRLGLTNYWGYNTIGYFAPDGRFATDHLGEQVSEFKTMVKRLHRAGIEVILDVVYNHTAEAGHQGPTLSFRGIDNTSYYRLDPADPSRYLDFSGTGNCLNMLNAQAMQLMMDSLRYWVEEMHVDGFRFDLAPALARGLHEVDRLQWFFDLIQQDPCLSRVKLIAEPWDLGAGGYQVGNFPTGWAEWNGKYRDTVRRFWRGDAGRLADLGYRLAGSSDLYDQRGRSPHASINFVTCHDGFTLSDLVSFDRKHNEANGEGNRDGSDANWSRNWGTEGPTGHVTTLRIRDRTTRNFIATLALSQGVPMLSHGDELGRTQRGNNNAYCQDNEVSWVDWTLDKRKRDFFDFTRRVFAVRRANPVFRRRGFFRGRAAAERGPQDVTWLHPDGREMTAADWAESDARVVGMLLEGGATDEVDERGRPILGNTVLLLLNAADRARLFRIPAAAERAAWHEAINTARPAAQRKVTRPEVRLVPHSLVLLTLHGRGPENGTNGA